jgi:mycoredoxin
MSRTAKSSQRKPRAISGRTNIPVIQFADGKFLVEPSDAELHAELKLRGLVS